MIKSIKYPSSTTDPNAPIYQGQLNKQTLKPEGEGILQSRLGGAYTIGHWNGGVIEG